MQARIYVFFFFFSSRRRHTRCREVSWARRCVQETGINAEYMGTVNQEVVKKMYRSMTGTIVPQGDFDYCLNSQLVPDVLDATGKGGYHDMEIDAVLFDFADNTVKQFFDIMPTLKERYTGTEEFIIHCQHSRFETTNDLTQRNREYPILQLQHPQYCFFYIASSGEYFLIVDIFLRFYYEMKAKEESFFGHVLASELYSFSTVPILPASKHSLLQPHMEHFAAIYSDSELISPGIRINPNRHKELTFTWAYIMTDEICFYYHEKKPIYNSTRY
eukprot:TRINITY_DN3417_c0_g1_i3.p1 TRINITY_DN3417_c0_g1~~TRINITY_DN3417_c0_g1_i3.p1  ORF type:complete len:274 (-),score=78.15 TRINITY_DN3417_c0_g1_i3:44-865(-)